MLENKYKLNNEEGSGLVLALMVLLVLSVLGASLGVITIGSLQLSDVNHDTNSAYYIAEAGVNMAYEDFKKIVKDIYGTENKQDKFYGEINKEIMEEIVGEESYNPGVRKTYNQFASQFGDKPVAKVSIYIPEATAVGNEREYTIKSIGKVDGKERTVKKKVSVKWIAKSPVGNFPSLPENTAAIVREDLEIVGSKATTEGYVYTKYNDELNKNYLGKSWEEALIIDGKEKFQEINFNKFEDEVNKIVGIVTEIRESKENSPSLKPGAKLDYGKKGSMKLHLKEDATIDSLNLKGGNHEIDIDENNVILAVNNLEVDKANLRVVGSGTLTIVVSQKANFDDSEFITREGNIRIILTSSVSNNKGFEVKSSTVNAQIIALFSGVTIHNSGKVFGNIVAKTLEFKNKGELNAEALNINDSESFNPEDLFAPEPTIESDQ